MDDKKRLLKEFEEAFSDLQKEFGFTYTLDQLDDYFNLRNGIIDKGFVPGYLYKALCSVVASNFRDWHSYFNNLLLPNSGYYASQTEAKLFSSEEDKKMLWKLIKKTMEFSSMSSLVNLKSDKELAKKFLDESILYWANEFQPKLVEIITKVNEAWKKE
ncbi:hypothetical protein GW931_03375 [archaeon]|nr:hypothetical protein [archaeon]